MQCSRKERSEGRKYVRTYKEANRQIPSRRPPSNYHTNIVPEPSAAILSMLPLLADNGIVNSTQLLRFLTNCFLCVSDSAAKG